MTEKEIEHRVRVEIAKKMQADRLPAEMIKKYTGVVPEAEQSETTAVDLAAKQVACEMLLRGLPLDVIATATGVPYPVLRELRSQMPE